MRTCATILGIFSFLAVIVGGTLLFFPVGYIYATYENLYGEWLQFSAFAGIAVYCFLIVRKRRAPRNWFYILLGLAAFYTAMEEISWGQQIFGWKSSELFQEKNLQGETNLHNFFTGPYSTTIKDLLTYALTAGMLIYGVLYPLMQTAGSRTAEWLESLGIPAPSRCLIPFFALAAYCEMSFHHFNEAELAELFVALALLFICVAVFNNQPDSQRSDARVAGGIATVFIVTLIGSVALTQVSVHGDHSSKRVANRIEAGIKKFAGRYARVESWDHAIDLYRRHLAYEPDSRSRLRRLAGAYESAGDLDNRESTLRRALELDLQLLKKEPWRASLHRSLYRTYRELGDETKQREHIDEALHINRERLKEHPRSAAAAYSIARTYDLLGRESEAIAQYRRAFQLEPGSSKYRRAYRDAIDN